MKTHRIMPGLYISRNALDLTVAQRSELVRELRLGLVINLWRDDPGWRDIPRLGYFHVPIPDGQQWRRAELERLACLVASYELGGPRSVLITCHAGRNRSGLLAALIVREVTGESGARAMEIVRAGRPRAIANPYHAAYLESLT